LRVALIGMIGTDDPRELANMIALVQMSQLPDEDKNVVLNAIAALASDPGVGGSLYAD